MLQLLPKRDTIKANNRLREEIFAVCIIDKILMSRIQINFF